MKSSISEKNLTDGLNYQMDMLNERIINFKIDQPKLLKLMPRQNLFTSISSSVPSGSHFIYDVQVFELFSARMVVTPRMARNI